MNEEALNAAYQHFTGGGYSGNIEDFKNLISTNSEAFNASFSNFKNGGYKGSTEDFSKLIGVELGKTKGAVEVDVAAAPQPVSTGTELASENGSLDSQFNPSQKLDVGIEVMQPDAIRDDFKINNSIELLRKTPRPGDFPTYSQIKPGASAETYVNSSDFRGWLEGENPYPFGDVEGEKKAVKIKEIEKHLAITTQQAANLKAQAKKDFTRDFSKQDPSSPASSVEMKLFRIMDNQPYFSEFAKDNPDGGELKDLFEDWYKQTVGDYEKQEMVSVSSSPGMPGHNELRTVNVPKNENYSMLRTPSEDGQSNTEDMDALWGEFWNEIVSEENDSRRMTSERRKAVDGVNNGVSIIENQKSLEAGHIKTFLSSTTDNNVELAGERELAGINTRLLRHYLGEEELPPETVARLENTRSVNVRLDGVWSGEGARELYFDYENMVATTSASSSETSNDVTGVYEQYLSQYQGTEISGLRRLNNRALFERAGWEIEKKEAMEVVVTDLELRKRFAKYKSPDQNHIYNVPLGELVASYDGAMGTYFGDYGSPDIYNPQQKGITAGVSEMEPTSYEGLSFENEDEFKEYLDSKKQQVADLSIREQALWQTFYLNKDPLDIEYSKGEMFMASVYGGLGRLGDREAEKLKEKGGGKAVHDEILYSVAPEADLDLNEDQVRALERSFGDEAIETAGGLLGMTPHLVAGNKLIGLTGAMKLIQGANGVKYLIGGKRLREAQATRWALKNAPKKINPTTGARDGKMALDALVKNGTIKTAKANGWEKGSALLMGGVLEDFKMREVMGATGGQQFDRGVGFGFYLGGKVLPFSFKPGAGARYDFSTKPGMLGIPGFGGNRMNTFLELTAKGGSAFTLAAEAGDVIGATVDEMEKDGAWNEYVETHWGDYDKAFNRTILHMLTGSFLGATHLKANDLKTYDSIKKFGFAAGDKLNNVVKTQRERAKAEGVDVSNADAYNAWKEEGLENEIAQSMKPGEVGGIKTTGGDVFIKESEAIEKYTQDLIMATTILWRANDMADWTDPVKGEALWKEHMKPIEDLFKAQGKNLTIEFTDQPIYQATGTQEDGTMGYQEVGATYTRLSSKTHYGKESKSDTGVIRVNLKAASGKGTMSHEGLHAYLDIMFDGKPQLKAEFESSFKAVLEKVQIPGEGNLYQSIIKDKALEGDKTLQLEEMMTYTAEYLSKVENAHLVNGKAFNNIARFFNTLSKDAALKNGDFYTGNDVIRMLKGFGETGDVKLLKHLDQYVDIAEGSSGSGGTAASRTFIDANNVKETATSVVENLKTEKDRIIQDQKDLALSKPDGFKEMQAENVKRLGGETKTNNKGEVEIVEYGINDQIKIAEGILKEGNPRDRINQHIGQIKRETVVNKETGKEETKIVKGEDGKPVYESKFTKEDLKDIDKGGTEEGQKALRKTMEELLQSELVRNMMFEGSIYKSKPDGKLSIEAEEYLGGVRDNLVNRLRKNYDPSVNPDVFGWVIGVSGGVSAKGGPRQSILFRAKGDQMLKAEKKIKTTSNEVIEGYENMFGDEGAGMRELEEGSKEVEVLRKKFADTVEYSPEQIETMEGEVGKNNVDVTKPYKHVKKLLNDQTKKMVTDPKTGKSKFVVPTKAADVQAIGPLKEVLRMEAEHHGVPLEDFLASATIPKYRDAARKQIYKDRVANIQAMPDGTSPSGKSMGVATSKFGEFLVKGQRVRSAKTGSTQGLAEQELKLDRLEPTTEMINEYLELFGIKPDGSLVTVAANKFDGAIKQQIIQRAALNVNQIARFQQGKKDAPIGEGRSPIMASRVFDAFKERFPDYTNDRIHDAFYRSYFDLSLTSAEKKYFDNIKIEEGLTTRDQAIEFGLIESKTMAEKSEQFKFDKSLESLDFTFEKVLPNGDVIVSGDLRGLDISSTRRTKDGQIIVKADKIREMLDHSGGVGQLLYSAVPELFENKSLISQMLFIHQRTTAEGISAETIAGRKAKGKGDIVTETGESAAGLDFTKGQDAVLRKSKKQKDLSPEDIAAIKKIWKDVKVEFTSANSQVTGAKKFRKAETEAERMEIAEKYFSELSEKSKEDIYNAMGSTLEYYVGTSKNKAEYLSRAEYVMKGMRGNTNLRLGFRQLAPILAVYKGKGSLDVAHNLKNMSSKELLKLAKTMRDPDVIRPVQRVATEMEVAGVEQYDAWRSDLIRAIKNQLKTGYQIDGPLKLEHLKTSVAQSYKAGELIVTGNWSKYGKETLKDFVGVLAPKELLDIIDAKGGKTNMEALYRMAILEPATLADFVTVASGGKQTLLDYVLKEGVSRFRELQSQTRAERAQDKAIIRDANAKLNREGFAGKGEKVGLYVASRVFDNHKKALKLGREKSKDRKGMSTWDFDDTLATTKSGVGARIPNPEGTPKPGRKVIFMAGGAGSGKGNVISKLELEKAGYKIVNSDISLEWLKKNHGLPENQTDYTAEQRSQLSKLTWEARKIAKHKQGKFAGKGDGVIVDGTGGSIKAMGKLVQEFKDKGYDASMVFVETSLEVAQQRNAARKGRSLREGILNKNHEQVQGNKEAFRELFKENFNEISTDNIGLKDALPKEFKDKVDNFTNSYENRRLDAEEFARDGAEIKDRGGEFDFSEFNKVTGGEPGPFLEKALERAKKFGTKDQFILTARAPEAAPAIHEFLKAQGLDIPLENITGLGNSTGEAKARWMLEKFAEGYNDMYFADDVMSNVDAVKKVLDQLDVKSKVQQALASRNFNAEINDIMQHSLGIESVKRFSKAEGRMRGKDAKRRKLFVPDTAADLDLLLEPLYGKGKQGIENKKWLQENFYRKFERGINDFNTAKQRLTTEYMSLRKRSKDVVKNIPKEVPGTSFSHDQAMRVYLWDKAGFKIPDLAETTKQRLVDYVNSNPKYKAYADNVGRMTGIETGLKEPSVDWWAETIATEITDVNRGVGRQEYLADFTEARQEIFSEENLNKMESKLGKNWRDTIEDMFERMETGRSRSEKLDPVSAELMNYFNGSVGTIMNFNTRSGMLQLISSVNFVNSSFNNPARAAQAFANQPQYWKDFMTILNSDMLKQRRNGLQINVTEAEIATAAKNSKNPARAVIAEILKAGYLPTKIADSFAIASGGATYYRNAIRSYTKQGMSKAQAEKQAFLDFQAIAERTQQSSRADLISKQQTTFAGRLILPFANTPMQMNRLALKEMLDIGKGRYKNTAELADKLGKIGYYGFIQTAIFAGLQSAAFAIFANSDDDDLKAKKKTQMLETITDSSLRGMGIKGAVVNGVINAVKEFDKQKEKGYGADYSEIAEDLLSISPPVGSKFRKMDSAGNTYKYNKEQIEEEGIEFNLNSPGLEATTQVVEAVANIPANRMFKKLNNLKNAADSDYAVWERTLMALGWTNWDVNPDLAKEKAKDTKPEKKKKKKRRSRSLPKYGN